MAIGRKRVDLRGAIKTADIINDVHTRDTHTRPAASDDRQNWRRLLESAAAPGFPDRVVCVRYHREHAMPYITYQGV